MQTKIMVVFNFKQNGLTICQHSLEEGSNPVTIEVKQNSMALEFAPAIDPETGVETTYPMVDGKQVFTNMPIILRGEELIKDEPHKDRVRKLKEGLTVQVNLVHPKLEVREAREDGLKCGDCELWNREVGVEELEKVTHVYQDGEGKMIREICEAMSVMHGKPLITKNNVGYCPLNQELSAAKSPGCKGLILKTEV